MRRLVAVLAAAVFLLPACSSDTAGSPADGAAPISPASVTQYGAAPEAGKGTTFQPDVVLVAGGGSAVRGVGDGGLTWYLDPAAAGAKDLAVGKIMFVTGRGVGRVVHVARSGGDLAVTIVPAPITDIVRDGHFGGTTPVSLSTTAAYDVGDSFWAPKDKVAEGAPGGGGAPEQPEPDNLMAPLQAAPSLPTPRLGGSASATVQGLTVSASCCSSGATVNFEYITDQFRVRGSVTLTMQKPAVLFDLAIADGKVTRATLQLTGGLGFKVDIAGATRIFANMHRLIPIPTDFSVPIGALLGVPMSATVTQLLGVDTNFHSKEGNIKASGEWNISGGLGFSYENGTFSVQSPTALVKKASILDSMEGISVGVNGIGVFYQPRVTVGIGAFGFTAGLYFAPTLQVSLVRGSALGSPITVCNSAQVTVFSQYGVGYTIPKPVADLVNFFLEKFGSKPIEKTGGIGDTKVSFSKIAYSPDTKICTQK